MKLKNILPIACILFAATSCSVEDELMNLTNPGNENAATTVIDGEATLALRINTPKEISTKTAATNSEKSFSSLSIVLLDGNNNIIDVYDNATCRDADNVALNSRGNVIIKTGKLAEMQNWRVLAIANAYDGNDFITIDGNYTTLAGIENAVLSIGTVGNFYEFIPKMGFSDKVSNLVSAQNYPGYTSGAIASNREPIWADIEVTQLAGRIDIGAIKVDATSNFFAGVEAGTTTIIINKVTFNNLYKDSYLSLSNQIAHDPAAYENVSRDNISLDIFSGDENIIAASFVNDSQPIAYSFWNAHADKNAVEVVMDYTITDEVNSYPKSATFLVNNGSILQGHLHRLNITFKGNDMELEWEVTEWVGTLPVDITFN